MPTVRTVTVKSSGGDYTSLQAALTAEQGDLVTLDRQLTIELWILDTTAVTNVGNWTTDSTRYVKITAASGMRAGTQRQTDGSIAGLNITDSTAFSMFGHTLNNLWIDGIQILVTSTTGSSTQYAFRTGASITSGEIKMTGCHLYGVVTGGTALVRGFFVEDSTPTYQIGNCIFDGFDVGFLNSATMASGSRIYNCTFVNCATGIRNAGTATSCILRNNGTRNCTTGITGTFSSSSDYNATSDASGTSYGANSQASVTPTMVDFAGGDYALASGDTAWLDHGTDLSADANLAITTDIAGNTRSGTFDIGASEYTAAGGTDATVDLTGVHNQMSLYSETAAVQADVSVSIPGGQQLTLQQGGAVSAAATAGTTRPWFMP